MTVELVYDETGEQAEGQVPLVILHGLLGQGRNWGSLSRRFGQGRRVLAVDLRNHGRSPWTDEHDYQLMAADLARLIETKLGGKADVLGHSMGGKASMVLALTRPELVRRLLVLDVAPVAYNHGDFIRYIEAMQAANLETERRSDIGDALMEAAPEEAIRAFLLSNLARGPEGFSWQPNLEALRTNMASILDWPAGALAGKQYQGPAFFLSGARSSYVKEASHPAIRALFPAARFHAIEGAGHWVHADNPGEFVAQATGFFAG
ncbi:alpha/beta fold hydrolase [Radicibacter daui]|uniref:alpha/beta fold hydrolase n=1 Tax=Radicibacter daui TaxID=3064829 RepID=UPI0040468FE7